MVLEFRAAQETEAFTGHPGATEGQAQIVIHFFEDYFVPEHTLVEVPRETEQPFVPLREGLPETGSTRQGHPKQGLSPGVLLAVVDAVVRVVGEERVVRIPATGCESPIAGEEEPVIRIAHQVHEERGHAVQVRDPKELLTVQIDEGALHGALGKMKGEGGF